MATLTIPDELLEQIRAEAAHAGQDENQYALKRLAEAVARDARRREEDWHLLYGPAKSAKESFAEMRRKYGIPDLSHLSPEELAAQAEAALAKVDPERVAEAERLGLIRVARKKRRRVAMRSRCRMWHRRSGTVPTCV